MPPSPPNPSPAERPPELKVAKFGGTSLADAAALRRVRDIVATDPARVAIVPSAPGKRSDADKKITDLLYLCHEHARQGLDVDPVFGLIRERFEGILEALRGDLARPVDLGPVLETARAEIEAAAAADRGPDYAASRGEAINGRILAALLDMPYVDAAEVIRFDRRGRLDAAATDAAVNTAFAEAGRLVVPGFYGSDPDGRIRTFSRGGSDVTGAIVARALGAAVYENWTDVSGLLATDPRIVDGPETIDVLTYRELRELSYMGATVLHPEAVFPVREAEIPVNIRNTREPDHPGTRIVATTDPAADAGPDARPVTGIAGRKGFTVIALEKALMNEAVGYGEQVLGVLRKAGVSFEHMPSGIDTLSVVTRDDELEGKLEQVIDDLHRVVEPDHVEVDPNLSLIAIVGRSMKTRPGRAAAAFNALAAANVNIRMIDQGSSELNSIVGVDDGQFETAVRAIYAAFFREAN